MSIKQNLKIACALPLVTGHLQAAETTESPTGATLEQVVVTAQKRSENVMNVPISIAAFTEESLENSGVHSTDDLQAVTPGVELRRQVTSLTPFIRGIGSQNAPIGVEASVALYIDGIYQSLPHANGTEFNNIERVEVLKGPQGTLFGRNATGGAVHIITKDPEQELSGNLKLGRGNYNTTTVDGYLTGGLADTLAADLAVQYSDQADGYDYNVLTGDRVNKLHFINVRNKWLWSPSETTTARLGFSYGNSRGGVGLHRSLFPGTRDVVGNPALSEYHQSQSNYVRGVNTGNSQFDGKDSVVESSGVTLRIDQEFDAFTLISITGYLDQESFYIVDQDVGPAPLLDIPLSHFNEQFSQEFQFLSNSEGPFSWLGGLYVLKADHAYDPLRLDGAIFLPLEHIDIRSTVETTSIAAFAESSYEFTDATKLTVGLRWTDDKKRLVGRTEIVPAPGTIVSLPFDTEKSWTKPTWRLVLDHEFVDDVMGYASFSRGFKSGSFNGVVGTGVPEEPVNPEVLDAYEIGLKTQLLNDRLAFTGAVFYYEFEDMQVSQQIPGGTRQSNAASSEINGAELNAQWIVGAGLELRAGLAYTTTEFIKFPDGPTSAPNPAGGNFVFESDLSGNELPRTPKWTGSLVADYSVPTSFGEIGATVSYYYNDGFFWEVDNRIQQDAYRLVNARLSWTAPEDNYGIELWGANLTDAEYAVFAVSEQTNDGYAAGAPRTYGANVFVKF